MNMDGALLYGGRYNPPDEYGALYLSDSPEACAAEMKRRPRTPPDALLPLMVAQSAFLAQQRSHTLVAIPQAYWLTRITIRSASISSSSASLNNAGLNVVVR